MSKLQNKIEHNLQHYFFGFISLFSEMISIYNYDYYIKILIINLALLAYL